MAVIDKTGILAKGTQCRELVLELGSGERKRHAPSLGIDIRDLPEVDFVGDGVEVLRSLPDGSARAIYAYHVFEHIADLNSLLVQAARVLRPGGKLEVVVPHFSNAYYYSDPTHVRPFGLYTFSYYIETPFFRRRVPQYSTKLAFTLVDVDLRFKSARPFYLRHAFRVAFGLIWNSCRFLQEFYEENLTGLVSCYEIRYQLRRN